MSAWTDIVEAAADFFAPSLQDRTPSWLGGAIVFGTMAAVIIGLAVLRMAQA